MFVQTSKEVFEVAHGPFTVNVSAAMREIIVDEIVEGLKYTFTVCKKYFLSIQ